jgi:hypothetical protein
MHLVDAAVKSCPELVAPQIPPALVLLSPKLSKLTSISAGEVQVCYDIWKERLGLLYSNQSGLIFSVEQTHSQVDQDRSLQLFAKNLSPHVLPHNPKQTVFDHPMVNMDHLTDQKERPCSSGVKEHEDKVHVKSCRPAWDFQSEETTNWTPYLYMYLTIASGMMHACRVAP